ncbi:class I SAM-dependent methyltransferase [uncultured Aquimarina sp.]|uniref:class I SAM-dependent methyltransferase n=1 Tax=uncultured Aquimarina sp. TaxID=575652 RepID=UPI00261BBF33|nr:class I SAM-dependent methyltransferase [uncultured Aquimarina sp.]
MYFFSTEVTSSRILSDRPLYLRTKKAYEIAKELVYGNVLEIGCGEGYGINQYYRNVEKLTLIDKSDYSFRVLRENFPEVTFLKQKIPPLTNIADNQFDIVLSFQVIEHIKHDHLYLQEIYRVLKPGGKALITTPNASKSIARNPWHYKEYDFIELETLLKKYFKNFEIKGIEGNNKANLYYLKNKDKVEKLLRFDIFGLQHKLPSSFLKIPYEILNRKNRKQLLENNRSLIEEINSNDYKLNSCTDKTLDFFCILEK